MYYENQETSSAVQDSQPGPKTLGKDYIDPHEPFVQKNLFAPGGILATYKKQVGITAKDVMEQDYWDKVKNLQGEAS